MGIILILPPPPPSPIIELVTLLYIFKQHDRLFTDFILGILIE